jgi:hypothetical protein
MSKSMIDFAKLNTATDHMLTDLLPKLGQLYELKAELTKTLKDTDETIEEIHTVIESFGVEI